MAMKCHICKGIIPDVLFEGLDRNDCRNHRKPEKDFDFDEYKKYRSE